MLTFFFRLAQEGALMTIPFLGSRIVYPTKKDIQTLLLSSDIDHPPSLTEMEPQTFDQLNALETGSVAFVYQDTKGNFLNICCKNFNHLHGNLKTNI